MDIKNTMAMNNSQQKQKVALFSMAASGFMSIIKIAAAMVTGSLGLLSEALHSLIDFGATIVTWFAIRWADRPADNVHQFGHAKIESIAALLETGLLFGTALFVAYEAITRLIVGHAAVVVSWWVVVLLLGSVAVDFNRSRALHKTAESTSSEALAADAAHFQSDMWSSLAVLAGLVGVWAGFAWADSLAALAVSGFIAHIGWELGGKTLNTLLDAAPVLLTDDIRKRVENQAGVLAVQQLRLRPAGALLFVDLVVDVARTLPVAEVNEIKNKLQDQIKSVHPNADMNIIINSVALDSETAIQKVAIIAAERGLAVHHLTVQEIEGRLAVSFDLEVDGKMTLVEAHETATALEAAVRQGLDSTIEVESHIEPKPTTLFVGKSAKREVQIEISNTLKSLIARQKLMSGLHNVRVRETEEGLFVHYHCRFEPHMNVEQVHEVVDRVEIAFLKTHKTVRRVVAHAEPIGGPRHEL